MHDEILIIYGSLNSVPSPEGAAPAKIIEETILNIEDDRFYSLSNTNPKLSTLKYNRVRFKQVSYNYKTKLLLLLLKVKYSYALRKQNFITASNEQLHYFIAVCLFVRKHQFKKLIVHVSPGLVSMLKLYCPDVQIIFYHHGTSLHTKLTEKQWNSLLDNTISIFGVNNTAGIKANEVFHKKITYPKYIGIKNAISLPHNFIEEPSNEDKFTFLFSGRICPEKGVLNLLKAFKLASDKNKDIKLVVAGGAGGGHKVNLITPYMKECYGFVEEHKLYVEFTGFLPKEKLYKTIIKAHVVVLSTDRELSQEGMPLCLIEGLAFSKPLIATNVGGNSELIEDGVNGYLINEYPYIKSLADKMIKVSSDSELYYDMKEASFNKYINEHTYSVYIQRFKKALNEINFI